MGQAGGRTDGREGRRERRQVGVYVEGWRRWRRWYGKSAGGREMENTLVTSKNISFSSEQSRLGIEEGEWRGP